MTKPIGVQYPNINSLLLLDIEGWTVCVTPPARSVALAGGPEAGPAGRLRVGPGAATRRAGGRWAKKRLLRSSSVLWGRERKHVGFSALHVSFHAEV